jgi:drug/metabolite transporter (DMT)-like permease
LLFTSYGLLCGAQNQVLTDKLGIAFGLGAAVLYASVVLLNKFIKGVAGLHRTFLQFLAAIAVLIPYVVFSGEFSLGALDGMGWGYLLILGLVHTGVAYCLYFPALKNLPGQRAAILSYLDPLLAVVLSVTVLGETMTVWQAAGGVLILGFTLWDALTPTGR